MTNKSDDAIEKRAGIAYRSLYNPDTAKPWHETRKSTQWRYKKLVRELDAADPLRLALGAAAIQAILNGEAAVVPLEWGKSYKLQSLKYTNGATSEHINLRMVHLDQPAKGDDHG